MMTSNEKLESYVEIIIDGIDDKEIASAWYEAAKKLPIPENYLEVYKLKYMCDAWRNTETGSQDWNKKVYEFADSLLRLEDRF